MSDFCDISRSEPDYYGMYRLELAELDRIKWLESERVGYDIGIHRARWLWVTRYRQAWVSGQRDQSNSQPHSQ